MWSGIGVGGVAESLAALRPDFNIDNALAVIEEDFGRHDGPGPVGAARFITGELDEEVQADVVGYAREFLRFMG